MLSAEAFKGLKIKGCSPLRFKSFFRPMTGATDMTNSAGMRNELPKR